MNDEFLTQYRKAPRAAFVEALYQQISQQPETTLTIWNRLTLRNAGVLLVLMVLVAACAYYVASQTPYHKVGGIWLTIQKTYVPEFIPVPEIPEETVPECPDLLPLDEAKGILRFDFSIPTWAPEGFVLNEDVCGASSTSDFVSLAWTGNNGNSYVSIFIQNLRWYDRVANIYRIGDAAVWEPIAPGSYEEVEVKGQPAVLIRGDWAALTAITEPLPKGKTEVGWDEDLGLRLYWVHGEALYELYTHMTLEELHHLYTMADVSPEDLIKMAESTR